MATTCDVCGKNVKYLEELLSSYQTESIKEVCPECRDVINKHLSQIKHATANITISWTKRFLNNLRETFTGKD